MPEADDSYDYEISFTPALYRMLCSVSDWRGFSIAECVRRALVLFYRVNKATLCHEGPGIRTLVIVDEHDQVVTRIVL